MIFKVAEEGIIVIIEGQKLIFSIRGWGVYIPDMKRGGQLEERACHAYVKKMRVKAMTHLILSKSNKFPDKYLVQKAATNEWHE